MRTLRESIQRAVRTAYFNEVLIEENFVLSFAPIPFTTAMMTSEMPAAIKPYSMAVAPDSSARNRRAASGQYGLQT
jgi:hypothetical protein